MTSCRAFYVRPTHPQQFSFSSSFFSSFSSFSFSFSVRPSVCLIIYLLRHPSHLCQDPDSISCTFLEQFVLAFQTAISHQYPIVNPIQSNPSDRDTKRGCKIKDFSENLLVTPFLRKPLHPGVQEKREKLGVRSPPTPWLK